MLNHESHQVGLHVTIQALQIALKASRVKEQVANINSAQIILHAEKSSVENTTKPLWDS